MLSSAHMVREVDLNSTMTGDFDPRARVYGFTVQAKVGAVLSIDMITSAGADSIDVAEGDELDTVMAIYGPMVNRKPGPLIVQVDDDDTGMAAQLPDFEVETEGEYLVLMSSWNDTGHGEYIMDLKCQGTDFQCRRPVQDLPCVEGTEYIIGGQSVGNATWQRCNYVLLEETHVEADALLTINPGVSVKGNFLGQAPYGDVHLVVDGTLQAIGTSEHPVLFSSLTDDGWGGLVLNGNSTLSQAFVENAQVGVEVVGDGNTLTDIHINTSETGVIFRGNTTGHSIRRGRITQVTNGIVMEDTVASIEDTVITGLADGTGVGIEGKDTTASFFSRALVADFGTGIDLTSAELEMVDATIINNLRGVHVTGEDAGVHPEFSCPQSPTFTSTPPRTTRPWPAPRNTWRRDPIFRRVDLVSNTQYAVRIDAPELIIIEDSNIQRNGSGILIASDSLHPDSRIVGNNIFGNGDGLTQLETLHNDGTLNISGNYWAQISDPNLSSSWNESHDEYSVDPSDLSECHVENNRTPSNCVCPTDGSSCNTNRVCGDYTCRRVSSRWRCDPHVTITATPWDGDVVFTGFSPVELDVGPKRDVLPPFVQDQRDQLGL